jgi:hypothetical protein
LFSLSFFFFLSFPFLRLLQQRAADKPLRDCSLLVQLDMPEIERTVANVARQRSGAHVDSRARGKGITPQDILRSAAIVLTQLVQVCGICNPVYPYCHKLTSDSYYVDDRVRLRYQCWIRDWQATWSRPSRINLDCGILSVSIVIVLPSYLLHPPTFM